MTESTRNLVAFLLFAALAATPFSAASALTVGVAPAQDATFSADADALTPIGSLVSGCLGTLFDKGFVATDARSVSISIQQWEIPSFGISGASEGRIDYIVALYATWKPSRFKKDTWLTASVKYRLVRVSDGTTLTSGSLDGPIDSEAIAQEAEKNAVSIGAAVASACVSVLGFASLGGK